MKTQCWSANSKMNKSGKNSMATTIVSAIRPSSINTVANIAPRHDGDKSHNPQGDTAII